MLRQWVPAWEFWADVRTLALGRLGQAAATAGEDFELNPIEIEQRENKRANDVLGPARCYLREKPAPFHCSREGEQRPDFNAATTRAGTIDGEPSRPRQAS